MRCRDDIDGLDYLNKGLASIAHTMMNAAAFTFDEVEPCRAEGHARRRELARDAMHITVSGRTTLPRDQNSENRLLIAIKQF